MMIEKIFKYLNSERDYIDEFYDGVSRSISSNDLYTIKLYVTSYITYKNILCDDYDIEAALIQLDVEEFGTAIVKKRIDDFIVYYNSIVNKD